MGVSQALIYFWRGVGAMKIQWLKYTKSGATPGCDFST